MWVVLSAYAISHGEKWWLVGVGTLIKSCEDFNSNGCAVRYWATQKLVHCRVVNSLFLISTLDTAPKVIRTYSKLSYSFLEGGIKVRLNHESEHVV